MSSSRIKPPDWLTGDALAQWPVVLRQLKGAGSEITSADAVALALYCQALDRYVKNSALVEKHGAIVKSPSGFPVQAPYVAIANRASEQMRSLMADFGMTPASRQRINRENVAAMGAKEKRKQAAHEVSKGKFATQRPPLYAVNAK